MITTNPDNEHPEYGPTLKQWQSDQGKHEAGGTENRSKPSSTSRRRTVNGTQETRAIAWTMPTGVTGVVGSYVATNLQPHTHGTALRIIGIALIAWGVTMGCELLIANNSDAYPELGMWAWITTPLARRIIRRIRERFAEAAESGIALTMGAALILPALFVAYYILPTIIADALPAWLTLLIGATAIHCAVTVTRYRQLRGGSNG